MKYKANTRRRAAEYEKDLLLQWSQNNTFEKSIAQRPIDEKFVFYDGPPFLTGKPHHGHLLISTLKDTVARFHTMKGKRVERRWGWDCHGLPAEVYVEGKLGIKDKSEIGTKISIDDYVRECRAAMVQTGTDWEDTISRIGRWVEFRGAYKTMDPEYMESVWWAFKELNDKGKIYEGEKVLMYCTKDATPISKSEVAMENSYKDVTDPSVYVKFKLKEDNRFLLAWTTTPWTLPSNSAVAVSKDLEYADVEVNGETFILAVGLIEKALTDEKHNVVDHKVIRTFKGSELVGKHYEPIFELPEIANHTNAYKVWHADFVHADDGTGIAHESPAYGEEDYELSQANDVPWVMSTDEHGNYIFGEWQGRNIWEVNKEIAKTLHERGVVWKIDYIKHDYPHCHRCGTKLMYRAHPSWFMDILGQKKTMIQENKQTHWMPKHLKDGRFHNILETAPDWNISRDRYWATPLPIWRGIKNDGEEIIRVFGSYEEFQKTTGVILNDYHLPQVMNVEFEQDGVTMKHVGKVLDCWFESGSMPFAQFHYPFENKNDFEASYPADFITEAIDQTRGWFYSLMAVNVGLFGRSPFKNVICTGFINAADGKKLSKKLGNYTDPLELMDKFSADSFRFLMLSSPLTNGENFSLDDKDVGMIARKLGMLWNMYDFFTMYAEVDEWEWNSKLEEPTHVTQNTLDVWIVSRLHQLIDEVDEHMKNYDLPSATKPVLVFLDDASNWYVRRSRKRFWKTENDQDKDHAYITLHYVLTKTAMVLAPFTPFLSEELYQKMTGGESVHLLDWPKTGVIDTDVVKQMAAVREVITEGLSIRAKEGIKVRQPLARANVATTFDLNSDILKEFKDIIAEELNVKEVECSVGDEAGVELDTEITEDLKLEGVAREVVRQVQNARKDAGLDVDHRISLKLDTDEEQLKKAIAAHSNYITHETLATFADQVDNAYEKTVKVEKLPLVIRLTKQD